MDVDRWDAIEGGSGDKSDMGDNGLVIGFLTSNSRLIWIAVQQLQNIAAMKSVNSSPL